MNMNIIRLFYFGVNEKGQRSAVRYPKSERNKDWIPDLVRNDGLKKSCGRTLKKFGYLLQIKSH